MHPFFRSLDYTGGGRSFLLEEEKPKWSFQFFKRLINLGLEGLCITKMHPEITREEYSPRKGTIFWLSKMEAPGIKNISPANLGMLRETVSDFIEGKEKCVILLDGLEYLITENGFDITLKFLHDVWEIVAATKS